MAGREGKEGIRVLRTRKRNWIGTGLLVISACMLTAGILRGEAAAVFARAITICLSCIGLG